VRSVPARFFHFKFVTNKEVHNFGVGLFLLTHNALQQKQARCKKHLKNPSKQQTTS